MTPYERLLTEDIPTRPPPARPPGPSAPWTPEEQAEHLRILNEALTGWHWQDKPRVSRHLRLVQDAA